MSIDSHSSADSMSPPVSRASSDTSTTSASTITTPRAVDISQAPAELFAQLLSGPLVRIEVGTGSEKREWSIHRNLLTHHSPVLASRLERDHHAGSIALEPSLSGLQDSIESLAIAKTRGSPHLGASQELVLARSQNLRELISQSQNLSLSFPEVNPEAFPLLVKYLYQGHLTPVASLPPSAHWDYAFLCLQLHSLASALVMPALQNLLVDQFRQGCQVAGLVPGADEIALVYRTTEPGSEMRKLVAQIAARQIMAPENERGARGYAECFEVPEFGRDVLEAVRMGVGGVLLEDPMEAKGCVWHVHAEGEACPEEGKRRGKDGILKKKVTFQK